RVEIAGDDPSAFALCQQRENDTDRPLANHKDCLALLQLQRLDPLQTGVDRLDVTRLLVGNMVRNLDHTLLHDPIHHADILGESTAARLVSGGHADLLVSRALREDFALAVVAVAAGDVVEDHHALADLKTSHAVAHRGDLTCNLVSEDAWRRVRAGGDLFQVVAADAADVHPNHHITRTDLAAPHA